MTVLESSNTTMEAIVHLASGVALVTGFLLFPIVVIVYTTIKNQFSAHPHWADVTLKINTLVAFQITNLLLLPSDTLSAKTMLTGIFFLWASHTTHWFPNLYSPHSIDEKWISIAVGVYVTAALVEVYPLLWNLVHWSWMATASSFAAYYWWNVLLGIYTIEMGAPNISINMSLYYPSSTL